MLFIGTQFSILYTLSHLYASCITLSGLGAGKGQSGDGHGQKIES